MRVGRRGSQVWAFRVPDVLLPVGGENLAVVGDEVGRVVEDGVCWLGAGACRGVVFDDSTRDNADVEVLGEGLVGLEVFGSYLGVGLW